MPAITSPTRCRCSWRGSAFTLQSRPADETTTYGYHRAGVLSAFVNAIALVVLSGWILYEAIYRLQSPEKVSEGTMIAVASLGLLMNGGIMLSLRQASRNDLNVRSAFVHMLGDALGRSRSWRAPSSSTTPVGCRWTRCCPS